MSDWLTHLVTICTLNTVLWAYIQNIYNFTLELIEMSDWLTHLVTICTLNTVLWAYIQNALVWLPKTICFYDCANDHFLKKDLVRDKWFVPEGRWTDGTSLSIDAQKWTRDRLQLASEWIGRWLIQSKCRQS